MKVLSVEPLLAPLPNLILHFDWVIVGGESGAGARAMEANWVKEISDICLSSKVPFFFKQKRGVFKKRNGRIPYGRTWDQMPGPDKR